MVPARGRDPPRWLAAALIVGAAAHPDPRVTDPARSAPALQPSLVSPAAHPTSHHALLADGKATAPLRVNGSSDMVNQTGAELGEELDVFQVHETHFMQNGKKELTDEEKAARKEAHKEARALGNARDRAMSQLLLITCLVGVIIAGLVIYWPDFPWSFCDFEISRLQRVRSKLTFNWLSNFDVDDRETKDSRDGCKSSMKVALYSTLCFGGAVLVGVMSPIQATINAMVSQPYGSPLLAATLCQDIELMLLIPLAYALYTSRTAARAAGCESDGVDPMLSTWMFAGGPLGGFYVVSLTMLRTMLAVEVTFVAVNLGQLLAATGMDQIGFAGLKKRPLTRRRALAIFVNVVACVVLQIQVTGGSEDKGDFTPIRDKSSRDDMHAITANVSAIMRNPEVAHSMVAVPGPDGAHWSAALLTYWFGRMPSHEVGSFSDWGSHPVALEGNSKEDPSAHFQAKAMAELNKADAEESSFTFGTFACVVWAMLAGASATVQTCINTRLAKHIRGPWRASYINAVLSSMILAFMYLWQRLASTGSDAAIEALPWELPLWQTLGGGLLGVFCAVLPVILTPTLGVATIYVVVLFGQLFCSMVWQIVVASIAGTLEPLVLVKCIVAALLSLFGSWLVRNPDD
jgi:transporter family-2 protein